MTQDVASPDLRSARFRKDREADWKRLDQLVTVVERKGIRALGYDGVRDLATTYRQTINSLSVAREISMDQALLSYLENLAARAYLVVYAPQETIRSLFVRLFTHGIPQAVRRSWLVLLIGFGSMFLGAVLGYTLFMDDETWFSTFVSGGLAEERRPGASYETLRNSLFSDRNYETDNLAAFASRLFSHNTGIAIMVFALGVFLVAPSFLLTFYNGTMLGAFFALFVSADLGYEVFGWLSIHGVTEISAICVACAGGVQLGLALLMPGDMTRGDALRYRGRDGVKLLILAALMLLVAGIVEGFFRQLVQSSEWRLVIGWGLGAAWVAWLALAGRNTEGSA